MRIALFGATGGTGKAFITQALGAGHSITALVRDPSKLEDAGGITVVEGDARDPEAVARTLEGADAAVSTLGNFNREPNTEISDATQVIIEAMQASGPTRFIVVTTIGVGDSYRPLRSFLFKYLVIGLVARNIWKDREVQETKIMGSGLDWTIARPGGLKNDPGTGQYQVIPGGGPQPKKISIAREDVADYCLKALSDDAVIKQTVCLFY
ncbi:MAG: SDR family oxidoreductase [Pseudomonadota bacterium]